MILIFVYAWLFLYCLSMIVDVFDNKLNMKKALIVIVAIMLVTILTIKIDHIPGVLVKTVTRGVTIRSGDVYFKNPAIFERTEISYNKTIAPFASRTMMLIYNTKSDPVKVRKIVNEK